MFATAFNAMTARCLVGLATAMLLLPSFPDSACGCSDDEQAKLSSSVGECQTAADWNKAACCCSFKNRRVDSCCERGIQAGVSTAACTCCCGPMCHCGHAQLPDPQPAAPITPEQNNTERSQRASMACIHLAVDFDQTPSFTRFDDAVAAVSTALERCISLTRFLC